MSELGSKIKEKRKLKGLTQSDLAEIIGVSKHAIAKYEQGQREPNLTILTKIIDELEIDFWEVSPSMDIKIDPDYIEIKPYEEGRKFAEDVYNRVIMKKHAKKWVEESSKEEIIDQFIRDNKDLGIYEKLSISESREFIKKYGEDEDDDEMSQVLKEYIYFREFRDNLYEEIREAILFTIELKLKEVDKKITKYCE